MGVERKRIDRGLESMISYVRRPTLGQTSHLLADHRRRPSVFECQ